MKRKTQPVHKISLVFTACFTSALLLAGCGSSSLADNTEVHTEISSEAEAGIADDKQNEAADPGKKAYTYRYQEYAGLSPEEKGLRKHPFQIRCFMRSR